MSYQDNQKPASLVNGSFAGQNVSNTNSTPCNGTASAVQKSCTSGIARGEQTQDGSEMENYKRKRSKEDVDAGETLLVFLQELRRNHNKALSMRDNEDNCPRSEHEKNVGESSASSDSLTMTTKCQSNFSLQMSNEVTDSSSSTSGGEVRSVYTNKDESTKSESSNESTFNDTLSEDDQKQFIQKGLMGPIRKRFRRTEFSCDNIEKHNTIAKN